MKKIVHIFLIIIFLIIIVGGIVTYFLPKNIEIETTKNFNAPISQVFQEFNDLENYGAWGPWVSDDSINTKINYFSPYKGKESSLSWTNKKDADVEKGDYKILDSKMNEYIKSQIIFDDSFTCTEDIFFQSDNENTIVTVKLKTDNFPYLYKIFSYLYTTKFEEIIEKSLVKLTHRLSGDKDIHRNLTPGDADYTNVEGIQLLAIKNETSTDPESIYKSMQKSLSEITQYLTDSLRYVPSDIKKPIAYYTKFDTLHKTTVFYAGYPIKIDDLPDFSKMQTITIPKGRAIFTPIKGTINDIQKSRYTLNQYAKENGINLKNQYWEEYQDFPITSTEDFLGTAYHLIIK